MIGHTLGHYHIVEKIGAGGMGEVYRAHDEQLDRDVALKVLPAGMLVDELAGKRFRREALTLAKLNHPNIETVFEFSTQDGVDFLAMELIRGTSMSEKLSQGPLPEPEVLRPGIQFAEGLAAAHEQGVVHRDLKPSNLMLTPEGRLKILDFGLATLLRPTGDPDVTCTVTETQIVSGTLPYMAPEQLRDQPADARSDIYAAGTVLYEMVAGHRPFPQSQRAELIGAILHETPAPPSKENPQITPALEAVILKALDKEPERRYQSARELLVVLDGLGAGVPVPARARARWPLAAAGAAAISLVLLMGLILGLNLGGLRDRLLRRGAAATETAGLAGTAEPVRARRSVAVLGFKNLSGRPDAAWLSTALSEMMTTELAAGEKIRTIPGENVARMRLELSLAEAESYSRETLARIRKNLGADLVILGSYLDLGKEGGGKVRLDLRLQDTSAGETIASLSETGTEAELLDLVSRAGVHLRERLGAGELSAGELAGVRASLPSNPEAARLYAQGLAKLRSFDVLAARPLLEKAVAADPQSAFVHSALAAAWSVLGYDSKAKQEAKTAFDLSEKLSPEERLAVEGRYRAVAQEWDKAVETYRTLWKSSPDNLEYGLRLAEAQTKAGKAKEALITVDALRTLAPPTRDDPRIDLAEALAANYSNDFMRGQAAGARAAAKGAANGAALLVVDARLQEGFALFRLGEIEKARATLEEVKRIAAVLGDLRTTARVLNASGDLLRNQGDLPGAEKMYQQSLALFRRIGNRLGVASVLLNIGGLLVEQGDLVGAEKMYKAALPIHREIDNRVGVADTLTSIGGLLLRQGKLVGAEKMYEAALPIYRDAGYKNGIAWALQWMAVSAWEQGDTAAAKKMLTESLSISEELGDKGATAVSRANLAELSIDEGDATNAGPLAQKAIDEARAAKNNRNQAYPHAVLALAFLAHGKLSDAQEEINRATALVEQKNRWGRLHVGIIAARVRAATCEPADTGQALKNLEGILAEATKTGYVLHQLEARFALGEIEGKSGRTVTARAHLEALEKHARAMGFGLIARKAAEARKQNLRC